MSMKRARLMIVLVTVLALVLAACAEAAPTATPTSAPTEVPPTEEPTVEPTEEATEEPTVEPTEEPTEEPTAEPTEEATEEAVAVAQATEEATEEPEAEATEEATEEPVVEEPGTIVEIAVDNEDFSTLVAAVTAADLVETLSGEGPFTVFAPTNAAFEAALEALGLTAEELLADTELLTSVLTYHVVAGEVLAETVVTLETATTVQGSDISIAVVDGGVVLNDSVNVVATDIMASNGVIHVIDGVLLPPAGEPEAEATEDAASEDLADAAARLVTVAPDGTVVVGVATTLSGEGLVPFGEDIRRGVELALADRPTVTVNGVEFAVALEVQDDQCNDVGGQAVANRFASDERIVAVVGPMCSSACRTAAVIFDREGYTTISSSCTAVDLTSAETGFASFNRTTPNDDAQGNFAAEYIYNELGVRRLATVDDSSTYGAGLVAVVRQRFEELGGTVVFVDSITVGDTDFRDVLDNAAAEDPELIYFGGFNAEGARLVEQRAEAGLENIPFMGADGIWGPEFIALGGSAAAGAYATSPVSAESEAYTAFVAAYEETFNTAPTAAFHAYAYDGKNMILDAIEAVGTLDEAGNLVIDRDALAAYIRTYGAEEPVVGLSGVLSCDGTGECATGGIAMFQVVDGAWVRLDAAAEATDEAATEEATEEPVVEEPGTIVEIAVDNEDFSTLVAAVTAADLVETLSGEGPFTVFAPTNAAFEAALEALGLTAEELLADTELLTSVLTYHVVAGEVLAETVVTLETATTVQGSDISIAVVDGGVVLNDSVNVVATDIMASNGVIHVIDGVLLPPAGEPEAEATEDAASEDLADAAARLVTVAPDGTVVVGVATTLSGEGLVPFGEDIRRGVELALADRPTVTVNGVEFAVALEVQDDQCNDVGGQAVANRFASDERIVAVVGPMCSSACRTAAVIFDREGYTTISSSCTAVDLTSAETGFASFNRTTPNDDAQGNFAAEYIYNELGVRRLATVDDSSTYGAGLVAVVRQRFEELGGTVVFVDSITVGDTDFRDVLDNAAAEDPELIYFGGFNAEGARLVEQRAEAGLENIPFMGADGIWGPEFIALGGSAAAGAYATSPVSAESEAYTAFVAAYEETFNTAPTAAFHAYAYDGKNMILDAIEAVGTLDEAGNLVIDRDALAAYIRTYGAEEPVVGLSGVLSCDGTGECATGGIAMFQVVDGAWVRLDAAAE